VICFLAQINVINFKLNVVVIIFFLICPKKLYNSIMNLYKNQKELILIYYIYSLKYVTA
jgi:LytS/YehU family sensor histidine kinase